MIIDNSLGNSQSWGRVLASNQISVNYNMSLPVSSLAEITSFLPQLSFKHERHNLVKFKFLFFNVRKACQFFSLYQIFSVWQLQVAKSDWSMTNSREDATLLIYFSGDFVNFFVLVEIPYGSMTSCKVNTVVFIRINFGGFFSIGKVMPVYRISIIFPVFFAHVSQTHRLDGGVSSSWTGEVNTPTWFNEFVIEMGGLWKPDSCSFGEVWVLFSAGDKYQSFLCHYNKF